MSAKAKPGAYFTLPGMTGQKGKRGEYYYLLVSPNERHNWVDWTWCDLPKVLNNGWTFVAGEDEHIIEGAALVAPLSILFWEKE